MLLYVCTKCQATRVGMGVVVLSHGPGMVSPHQQIFTSEDQGCCERIKSIVKPQETSCVYVNLICSSVGHSSRVHVWILPLDELE